MKPFFELDRNLEKKKISSFEKTTVFYIKMSCLYADMILDLRKNSMNEVEKRFIDEKLKTKIKSFLSKSASFNNLTEGEFGLTFAH